jgi:aldehyde dehydrogenase (NAD+)
VERYVAQAKKDGGRIVAGGQRADGDGFFFQPTVIADLPDSSSVVQEEIFGPVLAIQTFRTFQEALDKANNTPYGLSGGIWTDKGAKIFRMTRAVRAGVIWANTFNKFDPSAPFGGYKESGIGREGGLHGLDAYVELV